MPRPPAQEATSAIIPLALHFRFMSDCASPDSTVMANIGRMAREFCAHIQSINNSTICA